MDNNNQDGARLGRRVVYRDVAERMGVSIMTVSRALRHDRHVAAALAARIRATAKRMGYRPDPMLASLVAYRSQVRPRATNAVIAYVTTGGSASEYQKAPFINQTFLGAEKRGRDLGYKVVPVWLPELERRFRDPSQVLAARGMRGIILAPLIRLNISLSLAWDEFSVVTLGYSLQKPAFNYAASHLFQDMCLAFDRVGARGYRRPVFVYTEDMDQRTFYQLHGAFLLKQNGLAPANRLPPLCIADANRREDLLAYLSAHRPDVVFSSLRGLMGGIKAIGYSIPRDIGYIECDTESRDSPISGVFQDPQRIGAAAMDRLNMQLQFDIRGVPRVPEGTVLYGEWTEGGTLARPPSAPGLLLLTRYLADEV